MLQRIYSRRVVGQGMIGARAAADYMFSVVLRKADQIRRYSISTPGASGWEVTLEREGETRHVCYDDWHRVERALAMFRREVSELTKVGWTADHRDQSPRPLMA